MGFAGPAELIGRSDMLLKLGLLVAVILLVSVPHEPAGFVLPFLSYCIFFTLKVNFQISQPPLVYGE